MKERWYSLHQLFGSHEMFGLISFLKDLKPPPLKIKWGILFFVSYGMAVKVNYDRSDPRIPDTSRKYVAAISKFDRDRIDSYLELQVNFRQPSGQPKLPIRLPYQ